MAHRNQDDAVINTDVLVVGGGLAGAWAAVAARRAGAAVVLIDKGYVGTSGVTATAGPGHWFVAPEDRQAAVDKRLATSFGLNERDWMERVLELTWQSLPTLDPLYGFPTGADGQKISRPMRGPEYMRAMRKLVEGLGATILDHTPALELLQDSDGAVTGARCFRRNTGDYVTINAGAVVLAAGGCAFRSHLLGAFNNTGDGYLMAAEAGADLSGMEFTTYYTVSPAHSSMTRSMSYAFATYYDANGHELAMPPGPDKTRALAAFMQEGPVYCDLGRTPQDIRDQVPTISPNFMLPFRRWNIDPYSDRFEVTLRGEGTVRGIGGLRVVAQDCATTVPGLYAAGDTATRELVAGAISGGGNVNSAWALSSGQWAGQGAAAWAGQNGSPAQSRPIGQAGLRPTGSERAIDTAEVLTLVQDQMLPYDKAIFRHGERLAQSADLLESAWGDTAAHLVSDRQNPVRRREIAAMLATARWSAKASLARPESRGMHQRDDFPLARPDLAHRILVGGLDAVWTRPDLQPIADQVPS